MTAFERLDKGLPDSYQFVGVGIGERLQQDSADDTEDRCIRAYSEGQCDQRDRCEHRRTHQSAQHMLELASERSHCLSAWPPSSLSVRGRSLDTYD